MERTVKVVMLPAKFDGWPKNHINSLFLNENGVLSFLTDEEDVIKASQWFKARPQNLFFVNDEPDFFFNGDLILHDGDVKIISTLEKDNELGYIIRCLNTDEILLANECQRIIACSNKSLVKDSVWGNPVIDTEFLKQYLTYYLCETPITKLNINITFDSTLEKNIIEIDRIIREDNKKESYTIDDLEFIVRRAEGFGATPSLRNWFIETYLKK